jgi:hypothetical protein
MAELLRPFEVDGWSARLSQSSSAQEVRAEHAIAAAIKHTTHQ